MANAVGAGISSGLGFGMDLGNMLNSNEQNRLSREQQLLLLERQANYQKDFQNRGFNQANFMQAGNFNHDLTMFDKSIEAQDRYYNRDAASLREIGLSPAIMAMGGGGSRLPTTNQVAAQGSNYRSQMAGNPMTSRYTGNSMQTSMGWGKIV